MGDTIAPGQPLAVIEAMKMQNMLSVGKAFVVKAIHVKVGESVICHTSQIKTINP